MKFGQQLELNIFPQWRRYYVRYRPIKNHIVNLFPTQREAAKANKEREAERQRREKEKEEEEKATASGRSYGSTSTTWRGRSGHAHHQRSASARARKPGSSDDHEENTPLLSQSPSPSSLTPSPSASFLSSEQYADQEYMEPTQLLASESSALLSLHAGSESSIDGSSAPPTIRTLSDADRQMAKLSRMRQRIEAAAAEISGRARDKVAQLKQSTSSTPSTTTTSTSEVAVSINETSTHGPPSNTIPPQPASAPVAPLSHAPSSSSSVSGPGPAPAAVPPKLGSLAATFSNSTRDLIHGGTYQVYATASPSSSSTSGALFDRPLTHQERMDQVIVKILFEIEKVDNFHRKMESRIFAAFDALKAQAAALNMDKDLEGAAADHGATGTGTGAVDVDSVNGATTSRDGRRRMNGKPLNGRPTRNVSSDEKMAGDGSSKDVAMTTLRSSSPTTLGTADTRDNNGTTPSSSTTSKPPSSTSISTSTPASSSDRFPRSISHHKKKQQHASLPSSSSESTLQNLSPHRHRRTATSTSHSYHPRNQDEDVEEDGELETIPLRAAFIALLRKATMLIHFADINYVAFLKLLKCFHKRATSSLLLELSSAQARESGLKRCQHVHSSLLSNVQSRAFYSSRRLDSELLPQLYRTFGELFEHGDVDRAKVVLLSSLTEQTYDRSDTFWLGLKIGFVLTLLGLLMIILVKPVEEVSQLKQMAIFAPIYRSTGLYIVWLWLWSLLVWIWDSWRIPYVLIFQLNPRTRLTHFQLQTEAANLTIVYLLNALLFLTHSISVVHSRFSLSIYPFALFLFVSLKFLLPAPLASNWTTRSFLLGSLAQVALTPFGKLRFLESYIGDVLTSMVKPVVDTEGSLCTLATYYFLQPKDIERVCTRTGSIIVPLLCALPLWWRFLQCLRRYYDTHQRSPHLSNALKYLIMHSVVIMAAYHPVFNDHHTTEWATYRIIWFCCCAISTLYAYYWDVTHDWGLCTSDPDKKHPTLPLLRSNLVFGDSHAWVYYLAMISNFFLRWIWVLTIIPFSFETVQEKYLPGYNAAPTTTVFAALMSYDQIIVPILGCLELIRRFQWSILRVEYEQIVQGTHVRVDSHLPIFLQQQGMGMGGHGAGGSVGGMRKDGKAGATMNDGKGGGSGTGPKKSRALLWEVAGMVMCLIVIALIAALS